MGTSSKPSTPTTKILVATSLSEVSDQVIAAALQIAQASGAELHVFHAFPLPAAYYGPPLGVGMGMGDIQTLKSESSFRRTRAEEQLRRIGLDEGEWPEITIETGAAHRTLITRAEELGCDLIVVGAHEQRSLLTLGSTADRVLRRATCPVLVVKDGFTSAPKRMLAPVDLSDLSEDSLRRGLATLASWQVDTAAQVDVLLVVELPDFYSPEASSQGAAITADEIGRLGEEHLREFLSRFASQTANDLRPEVRQGYPRQEILETAEQISAELILLGTHGRSGFQRLLLGSVASDVIRRSTASLLVVPPALASASEVGPEKRHVALSEALGPAPPGGLSS